jgi:hypothetical protein
MPDTSGSVMFPESLGEPAVEVKLLIRDQSQMICVKVVR